MQRRTLLATPLVATPLVGAPLVGAVPAAAQGTSPGAAPAPAAAPQIVSEEFSVPARDAGIELFVRNKRLENAAFRPDRTLLFVHGATYPAETAFDLPVGGLSWMDYMAGRGFDVWCMDVRGYGRSTRPPEMGKPAGENPPVATADQAQADVAAVAAFIREQRKLPRLVHMGWSWGTTLMARFASENPQLVERLVLYAPVWLREHSASDPGGTLGAYRTVQRQQARDRWLNGVPDAKKAALIPPGWFEYWADMTFATDPEGARQHPPVLRAPNGVVQELREYWAAGKPHYDPAKITAPTLLVLGEWDHDTPVNQATTLFQAVQVFLEEAPAA